MAKISLHPTALTPAPFIHGFWAVFLLLAPMPSTLGAQIVTDRPDFVEASVTVGAGVFQWETSAAYARDGSGDDRSAQWTAPSLLRLGVSPTLELRLETELYVRDASAPAMEGPSGWSDLAVGLKWHIQEPRGGVPSMAVLLHATLPSGSPDLRGEGVRPSLRLTSEWVTSNGLGIGLMPGVAFQKNSGEQYISGILGMVVGRNLTETSRVFTELAFRELAASKHGGTTATWGFGASLLLSQDVQWDVALSLPVSEAAPDLGLTSGLSVRFGAPKSRQR